MACGDLGYTYSSPIHSNFDASAGMPFNVKKSPATSSIVVRGVISEKIADLDATPWRYEVDRLWRSISLETRLKHANIPQYYVEKIALTLTGEKNWYGLPVQDKSAHTANYAACLLQRQFLWMLGGGAFGIHWPYLIRKEGSSNRGVADDLSQKTLYKPTDVPSVKDGMVTTSMLQGLSAGGDANRFAGTAADVSRHRPRFGTISGMIGISPRGMSQDDFLCVLYSADFPFIIIRTDMGYKPKANVMYEDSCGERAFKCLLTPGMSSTRPGLSYHEQQTNHAITRSYPPPALALDFFDSGFFA
jgi:hypothetical protein